MSEDWISQNLQGAVGTVLAIHILRSAYARHIAYVPFYLPSAVKHEEALLTDEENYVRGPQPALYVDPKSGATWSGRGRAPAWIANAKNRSRFLIDGATAGDKKPVATKAAGKKAPAAKKIAAKKVVGAKIPAKKAPAKNAPRQSVAVPAPVATAESDAELTT
jgi:hypothetical protein